VPRAYKTYTQAERLTILATAMAEGLSATDVHERFGVRPVTYYSWRKKNGLKTPTGRPPRAEVNRSSSENTLGPVLGAFAIVNPRTS
jgi:transposase-like protein